MAFALITLPKDPLLNREAPENLQHTISGITRALDKHGRKATVSAGRQIGKFMLGEGKAVWALLTILLCTTCRHRRAKHMLTLSAPPQPVFRRVRHKERYWSQPSLLFFYAFFQKPLWKRRRRFSLLALCAIADVTASCASGLINGPNSACHRHAFYLIAANNAVPVGFNC